MENINENQPVQPLLQVPTPIESKKWYQHKGIISVIILALVAGVAVFLYFRQTSIQDNKLLNSTSQTSPISLAQCKNDSTDKQGDCFEKYGEATKDINACKTIGVYPNDVSCALGVAIALDDVKVCDQISGFTSYEAPRYGIDLCRTGYAANKNNCELLPFSQAGQPTYRPERDMCFESVAQNTLDDSYCTKISSTSTMDSCYEVIGLQKNDATLCDKMTLKREFKAECYMGVAKATKDSSICDKITFIPSDIALCYKSLNLIPPPSTITTPTAPPTNSTSTTVQQNGSVDFTLNNLEATAKANDLIQFTGKIKNNTNQAVYLNGIGFNLSYSELVGDSAPFSKAPTKLKPGENFSGPLFTVYVSQVALSGDYTGSVNLQGGQNQNSYDIIGDQTFVIHVTK